MTLAPKKPKKAQESNKFDIFYNEETHSFLSSSLSNDEKNNSNLDNSFDKNDGIMI